MKHELEITFESNFIQIISNGDKSYASSAKIWPTAIKVCEENNCFKILGIATTTKPPSTIDSFNHSELFHELKIDHKFRIAWVEINSDAYEGIKFIENVLVNRGIDVKLFSEIDEAKTWLFNVGKQADF